MATKSTKTPLKGKRTKAEVEQAFKEIKEETAAARESADAKAEALTRMQEQETRAAFQDFSVESVASRISELNVHIGRALSGIAEELAEEVRRLASAREAVEIEKRELERLHKLDIARRRRWTSSFRNMSRSRASSMPRWRSSAPRGMRR
jgi:hypothetical protein